MQRWCPGLALHGDRAGGTYGGKMGRGCLWGPTPPLTGADSPIASCSWDRKNNPEPWNKLGPTDQYKVSTGVNWGGLALWGGGTGTFQGPAPRCAWGRGGNSINPGTEAGGHKPLNAPTPAHTPPLSSSWQFPPTTRASRRTGPASELLPCASPPSTSCSPPPSTAALLHNSPSTRLDPPHQAPSLQAFPPCPALQQLLLVPPLPPAPSASNTETGNKTNG